MYNFLDDEAVIGANESIITIVDAVYFILYYIKTPVFSPFGAYHYTITYSSNKQLPANIVFTTKLQMFSCHFGAITSKHFLQES